MRNAVSREELQRDPRPRVQTRRAVVTVQVNGALGAALADVLGFPGSNPGEVPVKYRAHLAGHFYGAAEVVPYSSVPVELTFGDRTIMADPDWHEVGFFEGLPPELCDFNIPTFGSTALITAFEGLLTFEVLYYKGY